MLNKYCLCLIKQENLKFSTQKIYLFIQENYEKSNLVNLILLKCNESEGILVHL